MFGYIRANIDDLSEEEKIRYRAVYCGLCKELKERYGIAARMSLSYDLTFLILLFSSLYEPEEDSGNERCIVHPLKKSCITKNKFTEYAADLTVVLAYYKCIDDWNDDRNYIKKAYSNILKRHYKKVKAALPRACQCIEKELEVLSKLEKSSEALADEAANSFGRLMGSLFVIDNDNWARDLYAIGYNLGRFIYMIDAAVDYDEDVKKNSFNPLISLGKKPAEMRPVLMQILGEVSECFEKLPLVEDIHLLRNILYSGVWVKFNEKMKNDVEDLTNDR